MKVFKIYNSNTFEEITLEELKSVNNLIYDFGGANPSLYKEENIVIVDILPLETFLENTGEIETFKIYIQHDLNDFVNLPKSSKIIVAHLYYHIYEVDNFCKTLNTALKINGEIHFKTGRLDDYHYRFFETLNQDYNFELPFHTFRKLSIWEKKLKKYLNTFYILKRLESEPIVK